MMFNILCLSGLCSFMVTWWLNGAVSMGITGLLPVVFLPLLGIVQYIILHIILRICNAVLQSYELSYSVTTVLEWGCYGVYNEMKHDSKQASMQCKQILLLSSCKQ